MGQLFGKVRRGTASYTDQRIRLMNEIVTGMKVIKMYSWEKSFAEMIADIRRFVLILNDNCEFVSKISTPQIFLVSKICYNSLGRLEVRKVMLSSFLKAVNLALTFVITRLVLFACLIAFISFGNQLTAEIVFVTSALVNSLKVTLTFFFPTAISTLSEALVSCERLKASFKLLVICTVSRKDIPKIL